MKSSKDEALEEINKIAAEMLGQTSGRHKRSFLYHRIPKNWLGTKYVFGYTPWRTKHDGKEGFFALKYRMIKGGDVLKLIKAVRFSKRKVARKRSSDWHKAYYRDFKESKEEQPLNRPAPSQTATKTKKGGKKMTPKIGKIQRAFNYHEKGKKVAWISKKLELSERTVRAYIWRIGNPKAYKELLARYFAKRKLKAQEAAKKKTSK